MLAVTIDVAVGLAIPIVLGLVVAEVGDFLVRGRRLPLVMWLGRLLLRRMGARRWLVVGVPPARRCLLTLVIVSSMSTAGSSTVVVHGSAGVPSICGEIGRLRVALATRPTSAVATSGRAAPLLLFLLELDNHDLLLAERLTIVPDALIRLHGLWALRRVRACSRQRACIILREQILRHVLHRLLILADLFVNIVDLVGFHCAPTGNVVLLYFLDLYGTSLVLLGGLPLVLLLSVLTAPMCAQYLVRGGGSTISVLALEELQLLLVLRLLVLLHEALQVAVAVASRLGQVGVPSGGGAELLGVAWTCRARVAGHL